MAFLVSKNLNLILNFNSFPHSLGKSNALVNDAVRDSITDVSQWHVLASINQRNSENSIGNVFLRPINQKKCICGKQVTHYCLIGNSITGDLLIIGFDCLKKRFAESSLFREYRFLRKLVRKCKHCTRKHLIIEMIGQCCDQCKDYRTSNYFGCISCLSYEKGLAGSLQCINCQIARRPYCQIRKCIPSEISDILEETSELRNSGLGFHLVTSYHLREDIRRLFEPEEKCIRCGTAIDMQEQIRIVPLDRVRECINCVYPNHGRCVDCNKFLPQIVPGKDKCIGCFKKFMRKCPKRQCDTCGLYEIPNLQSNLDKTQCYSCWKKSKK